VKAKPDKKPGSGQTVLVVDDDVTIRGLVARMVQEAGYRVIEAEHGMDALRQLEQPLGGTVDVVLTNTSMPVMNGPRLMEVIRHKRPDTPIVHMAEAPEDLAGMLGPGGPVCSIVKPFTRDELERALEQVLAR